MTNRSPVIPYQVFISHYSGDCLIAEAVSSLLDDAFVGHVKPFISSEIPIGVNWLAEVKRELSDSAEVLTVFTHRSADRPWVNIETGYGVMSDLPVTPILFDGLRDRDLSPIYQLQQAVVERDDAAVQRFFDSMLTRVKAHNPLARSKFKRNDFLDAWRSTVTRADMQSPMTGCRPVSEPVIWIIGSHDGLSTRDQTECLAVVKAIARISYEQGYRIVLGVSRLLEYLADTHESIAANETLLANASGDPWRKGLATMQVEATRPAPHPVVLVGRLRTPDIRRRFDDAIGRVPDIAIVVGGSPMASGGRTHEECSAAAQAGIPILPIVFTGGAASEVQPSLSAVAMSQFANLSMTQGKLDVFAAVFAKILRMQFGLP